jgi:hypothetical protein
MKPEIQQSVTNQRHIRFLNFDCFGRLWACGIGEFFHVLSINNNNNNNNKISSSSKISSTGFDDLNCYLQSFLVKQLVMKVMVK